MLAFDITESVAVRVERYLEHEKPQGALLDSDQVTALALAAVRQYGAYGRFYVHRQQFAMWERERIFDPQKPAPDPMPLDADFELSLGEWGVIQPLWHLYMERERSQMLEATRMMGDVMYGRSTSEIQAEISQYEAELHVKAFAYDVITI